MQVVVNRRYVRRSASAAALGLCLAILGCGGGGSASTPGTAGERPAVAEPGSPVLSADDLPSSDPFETDPGADAESRQVDWENQEGADWEAFSDSYSAGFDDGCTALFEQSPNGSLYEDDYEYTEVDCQNENAGDGSSASDVPVEVPEDPESAGQEIGELDGCQALFLNQGVLSLNYGQDSFGEQDCPV